MKSLNEIRRRVMKMAHVRRRADKALFGEVKGDFAYYLRGSWATVKAEIIKADEKARAAMVQAPIISKEEASASFNAGLLDYYGVRGRYYGD